MDAASELQAAVQLSTNTRSRGLWRRKVNLFLQSPQNNPELYWARRLETNRPRTLRPLFDLALSLDALDIALALADETLTPKNEIKWKALDGRGPFSWKFATTKTSALFARRR